MLPHGDSLPTPPVCTATAQARSPPTTYVVHSVTAQQLGTLDRRLRPARVRQLPQQYRDGACLKLTRAVAWRLAGQKDPVRGLRESSAVDRHRSRGTELSSRDIQAADRRGDRLFEEVRCWPASPVHLLHSAAVLLLLPAQLNNWTASADRDKTSNSCRLPPAGPEAQLRQRCRLGASQ